MASWSATRQTVINLLREKSYNRARALHCPTPFHPRHRFPPARISEFPIFSRSRSFPLLSVPSFRSRFVDLAIVARRRDVPTFAESAATGGDWRFAPCTG